MQVLCETLYERFGVILIGIERPTWNCVYLNPKSRVLGQHNQPFLLQQGDWGIIVTRDPFLATQLSQLLDVKRQGRRKGALRMTFHPAQKHRLQRNKEKRKNGSRIREREKGSELGTIDRVGPRPSDSTHSTGCLQKSINVVSVESPPSLTLLPTGATEKDLLRRDILMQDIRELRQRGLRSLNESENRAVLNRTMKLTRFQKKKEKEGLHRTKSSRTPMYKQSRKGLAKSENGTSKKEELKSRMNKMLSAITDKLG